jgi:hypothetical protein
MIAVMTGVLEHACQELGDAGRSATARETVAGRIIGAAKLGERDPARLLEAGSGRDIACARLRLNGR